MSKVGSVRESRIGIIATVALFLCIMGMNKPMNVAFAQDEPQGEWKTINGMINEYCNHPMPCDRTFPIKYKITSGTVLSILAYPELNALAIVLNSTSPGQLLVELPRNIIDSKQTNGTNLRFEVRTSTIYPTPVVFKDADYQETLSNPDHRTLSISYPMSTANQIVISIQGTYAIPEFNGLRFVALAIAMSSIIAITVKFNKILRF